MKLIIKSFDQYLRSKGLRFEAIVIGGAALNIMDVTNRLTRDVDLIDPRIPQEVKEASIGFLKDSKFKLQENWLNNDAISLTKDLPDKWRLRVQKIYEGKSLTLYTLGRLDLLKTKLYALCDRATDFSDCVKLAPSKKEIEECFSWVLKGDANPLWPARVNEMIGQLKQELGIDG